MCRAVLYVRRAVVLVIETLRWGLARHCFCLFSGAVQVKTKGARKITFEQFLTALAAISEKKVRRLPVMAAKRTATVQTLSILQSPHLCLRCYYLHCLCCCCCCCRCLHLRTQSRKCWMLAAPLLMPLRQTVCACMMTRCGCVHGYTTDLAQLAASFLEADGVKLKRDACSRSPCFCSLCHCPTSIAGSRALAPCITVRRFFLFF